MSSSMPDHPPHDTEASTASMSSEHRRRCAGVPAARLARLLRSASQDAFPEQELADLLAHQLAARLDLDDPELNRRLMLALAELTGADRESLNTFADLFGCPNPPIAVLCVVKDYAKGLLFSPDACIPRGLVRVIYYCAIVAAQIRCGQSISSMAPDKLHANLRWALAQTWVTGVCQDLLKQGLTP